MVKQITRSNSENAGNSNGTQEDQELFSFSGTEPLQIEKQAPCQAGCPSGVNIRGWLQTIAQRAKTGLSLDQAYRSAWEQIVVCNPLPATTGRICPHPCEANCNRSEKEAAVSINAMERFIGDWALHNKLPLPKFDPGPYPESIGVIGAGPAGLSFAYQMAGRGYDVIIYEKSPKPGGMLRYGVPEYRLPTEVLDWEIERILDVGVHLQLNTSVGNESTLEQLRSAHDFLFMGIGAHKSKTMEIQGEDGVGVWSGIEYLNQVNSGISVTLGKKVVVVGGGNTAVDAARVARRQGAEVTLLYRRTRVEMPAIESEIEDALAEQVTIQYLVSPVKVKRIWGAVDAVVVQEMILGDADDTGRRRPIPKPGSEREIPADSIIVAISQEPDWDNLLRDNQSISVADSSATGDGKVADDIWIGGDVRGMGIATLAISQGRKAAEEIHSQLRNLDALKNEDPVLITPDKVHAEFYESRAALTAPRRPIGEWLELPNSEVERTITEDQFLAETTRCFSCGLCFGCETCWMYCNASTFEHSQTVQLGNYFIPSLEICEGCGKCLDLCPCGYLSVS